MRKPTIVLLLFLFLGTALSAQYRYRNFELEPGIILLPMKSWWTGNDGIEIGSFGFGFSFAYPFNDIDGLQVDIILQYQQGISKYLPCQDQVPPCDPARTRVPYLKIPFMYRYKLAFNDKVWFKMYGGPQAGIFLGTQPKGRPYLRIVPDLAGGAEISHLLADNFYFTYGIRGDVSMLNPENPNATRPDGTRYFDYDPDRPLGRYINAGFLVGFHIIWD